MNTHTATADRATALPAESGRWLIWTAGLIVAAGAAVATAHGLYRVALAATVPGPIAWLYPLITDGLALVAYAATTRLAAGGRRYAWTVVVLAAGLSGLAQASYLAIGVHTAPVQLRFGVGAWPAVAAAITAHLLYLLAARPGSVQPQPAGRADVGRLDDREPRTVGHPRVEQPTAGRLDSGVQPAPVGHRRPAVVAPVGHVAANVGRPGDRHPNGTQLAAGAGPGHHDHAHPDAAESALSNSDHPVGQPPVRPTGPVGHQPSADGRDPTDDAPVDRARAAALTHQAEAGALPSVRALADAAAVSRGTAATALHQLRDPQPARRPGLRVVLDERDVESGR